MMSNDKRKIIYLDMDGVLADFESGLKYIETSELKKYEKRTLIPNYYLKLDLMPGAKDAVEFLLKHFEVYVLSTAPWKNPSAWSEKRIWLEKEFPELKRRLILSHHKNLLLGDYLIDDMLYHGAKDFTGEHIHFGSEKFPDWDATLEYLKDKEQIK